MNLYIICFYAGCAKLVGNNVNTLRQNYVVYINLGQCDLLLMTKYMYN